MKAATIGQSKCRIAYPLKTFDGDSFIANLKLVMMKYRAIEIVLIECYLATELFKIQHICGGLFQSGRHCPNLNNPSGWIWRHSFGAPHLDHHKSELRALRGRRMPKSYHR